jgi:hypothetical protein
LGDCTTFFISSITLEGGGKSGLPMPMFRIGLPSFFKSATSLNFFEK